MWVLPELRIHQGPETFETMATRLPALRGQALVPPKDPPPDWRLQMIPEEKERWNDALPGWRMVHSIPCPSVIVGRECGFMERDDMRSTPGNLGNRGDCVFVQNHFHREVFDHTDMWMTPLGQLVLITSPYPHYGEAAFQRLQKRCRKIGVACWRRDEVSPYGDPGSNVDFILMAVSRESIDAQVRILSGAPA